jgi:hypothetical protein
MRFNGDGFNELRNQDGVCISHVTNWLNANAVSAVAPFVRSNPEPLVPLSGDALDKSGIADWSVIGRLLDPRILNTTRSFAARSLLRHKAVMRGRYKQVSFNPFET